MHIAKLNILITGAGSGLGATTAKYLSSKGANIIALDINQAQLNTIKADINGLVIDCDVTDENSVLSALAQAKQKLGIPRVCINFAGILGGNKLINKESVHDYDAFKQVLNVNLFGTFNVMRLAIAEMLRLELLPESEERGLIINTASIAAFEGQIGQVAYSASKGAIAAMTLPAAREMAQHAIRVACVAPGVFDTPMLAAAPEKVRAGILSNTVFPQRLGKPEELAAFIAHIVENPMLNGDIFRIDGAVRLPPR